MNGLTRCRLVILIGLAVSIGTSCGRKATVDSEAAAVASKLPGASEVMAALEKKDYDGAVAALLKAGRTVANEEQQVQYMTLSRQVREKLSEAAPNDPKAAEALAALRTMTLGR
jgi:hypothetical protein